MFYVNVTSREYQSENEEGLVPIDDSIENAILYGINVNGEIVNSIDYDGKTDNLISKENNPFK
jgi:hypothetical protein